MGICLIQREGAACTKTLYLNTSKVEGGDGEWYILQGEGWCVL